MNAPHDSFIRAALRPSEALLPRFAALAMQVREWAGGSIAPVSLGVVGVKRGVGASTVAYNLAHALAAGLEPEKVALVDACFEAPFVFKQPVAGLAEVLQEQAELAECLVRTRSQQPCLLAAGKPMADAALRLPWNRLGVLLQEGMAQFEFLIFDLSPLDQGGLCQLVSSQLTGVLVVSEPDDPGGLQLEQFRRQLWNFPVAFLGRVINKSRGT